MQANLPARRALAALLASGAMLVAASTAVAADLSVTVGANGKHPSQLQWDGVRVYWAPFDLSTISPPDMVLCVVQDSISCSDVLCPDADKCTFPVPSADPMRPFALVIYDWDGLLDDGVSAAARGLSVSADAVARLKGRLSSPALSARADGAIDVAASVLSATSDALARANARRLEFMDAAAFAPSREEADAAGLADVVRAHVQAVARIDEAVLGVSRLDGPLPTFAYAECAYPSPACSLPYVEMQFTEKETDNADQ